MNQVQKTTKGFTVIELMIATAVFSTVLLLCATAIMQVGRMFYKGTVVNKTQDTARQVVDDIIQAIQFGGNDNGFRATASATFSNGLGPITVQSLCLGTVRYSYVNDRSLGSNTSTQLPHILWKDHTSVGNCTPLDITNTNPPLSSADGQEMMGDNMRIPILSVPSPNSASIWAVNVVVSYGDADVFVTGSNFGQCVSSRIGGQFCAVSSINTNVVKRL